MIVVMALALLALGVQTWRLSKRDRVLDRLADEMQAVSDGSFEEVPENYAAQP
jgi:hypothetical protein